MTSPYRKDIETAAKAHGVDADLLEALVMTESSGQADAFRFEPAYYKRYLAGNPEYKDANPRRVASSYGLCQIMYPTARQYGFGSLVPETLFLPGINLDYGARILAHLITRCDGDTVAALAAYNGGLGGIGKPVPTEYARKVLRKLGAIRKERTS